MRKLTTKQQAFVKEYLIDLNATKACIRAGYSAKTADRIGPELLGKTCVQAELQVAIAKRGKRTDINADYVLCRLVEIDQMDALDILNDNGSVRPISQWPKIWRQFISGFDIADIWEGNGDERQFVGVLKKIKWPDKTKNLELIGKHVNVQAFREKVELSGDPESPIHVITRRIIDRKE